MLISHSRIVWFYKIVKLLPNLNLLVMKICVRECIPISLLLHNAFPLLHTISKIVNYTYKSLPQI